MEVGFVKGLSNNLPKVDIFMVAQYLSDNGDYVAAEMRGIKLNKSGRDSYGDEAIGYVQIKRDKNECTVKCRITPEHRVRVKPYHCTFKCNEVDSQILSVSCEDCVASRGGCKHSIAFLMWLHRRTEEPAPTSVKCYWKKSTLSTIGTSLKFIKAKDFSSQESFNGTCDSDAFFENVKEKIQVSDIKCQLAAYVSDTPEILKLSIHYMICTFLKENTSKDLEQFINFSKTIMTEKQCALVQNLTIAQPDSTLWHKMRYGRVTASKAHEAAQCQTDDGCLVEQIFGAKVVIKSKAVDRGKVLEYSVRNEISKIRNIKIKETGLVLSPDLPYFGASPDGLTNDYVIEIKCPSKTSALSTYFNNGKITKKYFAQIQSQMYMTKKKMGLFCIAQPDFEVSKNIEIHEVIYDKAYCEDLFSRIRVFWEKYIFSKIMSPETQ